MALSIKHPEADRLARALAAKTGESLTEAVLNALKERLQREKGRSTGPDLIEEMDEIRKRCAQLPVLDDRSPEDIVGYDERGIPR